MLSDPIPPTIVEHNLGLAYFGAKRYKDAIMIFKNVLERAKKGEFNLLFAHINLAMTYAMLDQGKEALKVDPKSTAKRYFEVFRFKNQVDADHFINAAHKAGLPE